MIIKLYNLSDEESGLCIHNLMQVAITTTKYLGMFQNLLQYIGWGPTGFKYLIIIIYNFYWYLSYSCLPLPPFCPLHPTPASP